MDCPSHIWWTPQSTHMWNSHVMRGSLYETVSCETHQMWEERFMRRPHNIIFPIEKWCPNKKSGRRAISELRTTTTTRIIMQSFNHYQWSWVSSSKLVPAPLFNYKKHNHMHGSIWDAEYVNICNICIALDYLCTMEPVEKKVWGKSMMRLYFTKPKWIKIKQRLSSAMAAFICFRVR